MRKLFSIFLLGIYLFSNVEFCQLLKIPLFIEHYQEFAKNGEGDLIDFLVHHYGGHEKDSDWDTDMKLPFMTHTGDTNLAFYLPKIHFEIDNSPVVIYNQSQPIGKEISLIPSYYNNILQPPRLG